MKGSGSGRPQKLTDKEHCLLIYVTLKVKAAFRIEETLIPGGRSPGTEVRDRGRVESLPDICAGAGGHGRQGHQRDPAHRFHRSVHENNHKERRRPMLAVVRIGSNPLHPFVAITATPLFS